MMKISNETQLLFKKAIKKKLPDKYSPTKIIEKKIF